MTTKIAYVRVSTNHQDLNQQKDKISKQVGHVDKWFEEKISAKNNERSQLNAMLNYVREGDEVYVTDASRISRTLKDFLELSTRLKDKGVKVTVLDNPLINIGGNSDPTGQLITHIIMAIAQWEREIMLKRQEEWRQARKERGLPIGRKKALNQKQIEEIRQKYKSGISQSRIAKDMKVSRTTIHNVLTGKYEA